MVPVPQAEGALFYGETCSYACPLRFLFSGSPVSVSSPFPGLKREREGGAVRRGFRDRPLRGGCAGGVPPCAGPL